MCTACIAFRCISFFFFFSCMRCLIPYSGSSFSPQRVAWNSGGAKSELTDVEGGDSREISFNVCIQKFGRAVLLHCVYRGENFAAMA